MPLAEGLTLPILTVSLPDIHADPCNERFGHVRCRGMLGVHDM